MSLTVGKTDLLLNSDEQCIDHPVAGQKLNVLKINVITDLNKVLPFSMIGHGGS
ncbi:MAG: hypothetical protein PVG39_28270 [Desulfobacteraceae bacterium]